MFFVPGFCIIYPIFCLIICLVFNVIIIVFNVIIIIIIVYRRENAILMTISIDRMPFLVPFPDDAGPLFAFVIAPSFYLHFV